MDSIGAFPLIFAVAGLFVFFSGILVLRRRRRERSFPKVFGRVVSSGVAADEEGAYRPVIAYEYVVEGRTLRSDRYFAGLAIAASRLWAERIVARFPAGSAVSVTYNASAPRESFLCAGSRWWPWSLIAIGLIFLGFAASFLPYRISRGGSIVQIGKAGPTGPELRLTLALEDDAKQPMHVRVQAVDPHANYVKGYENVRSGDFQIPGSAFSDDTYYVYIGAPDFASQYVRCEAMAGQVTTTQAAVTLYRKRYVILRYVSNSTGGRDLTGASLQKGRVAITHWGRLRAFDDWQVWQSGDVPAQKFGPQPYFQFHRFQRANGFAMPPAGSRFDDLTEAPSPESYRTEQIRAVPGLILFCQTCSTGNNHPPTFGKLLVEDVTEAPPEGIEILDGSE